ALLVGRVAAGDGGCDLAVDVRHGARDALAVPRLAAVAQLGGLELAGRGPRWHRRMTVCSGAQPDLDLDRGVAATVEDLARVHALDLTHATRPLTLPHPL